MDRTMFQMLRHGYRLVRRNDASYNRQRPELSPRSREAERFLIGVPERMREAITAAPAPAVVAKGPKARFYQSWRPAHGRYRGMTLAERVAYRAALAKVRAFGRDDDPALPHLQAAHRALDAIDASSLRMQAERWWLEYKLQRLMGVA